MQNNAEAEKSCSAVLQADPIAGIADLFPSFSIYRFSNLAHKVKEDFCLEYQAFKS